MWGARRRKVELADLALRRPPPGESAPRRQHDCERQDRGRQQQHGSADRPAQEAWSGSMRPTEYKVEARMVVRHKRAPLDLVIPITTSVLPCSELSRYGLAAPDHEEIFERRPTLTAPARDSVWMLRVGTKKWGFQVEQRNWKIRLKEKNSMP